jgi:hypothetical protein
MKTCHHSSLSKWLHALAAALLGVATLPLISGCAGAAIVGAAGAGAAAGAYAVAPLEAEVEASPPQIEAAATGAFNELSIARETATWSALDTRVTGRTAEGDDVTVLGTAQEGGSSKLTIRVNSFGDDDLSRKIYAAILRHLNYAEST